MYPIPCLLFFYYDYSQDHKENWWWRKRRVFLCSQLSAMVQTITAWLSYHPPKSHALTCHCVLKLRGFSRPACHKFWTRLILKSSLQVKGILVTTSGLASPCCCIERYLTGLKVQLEHVYLNYQCFLWEQVRCSVLAWVVVSLLWCWSC